MKPPRLARFVLLALTPPRYRDDMDADLLDGFRRRTLSRGLLRAHAWYWRQLASPDLLRLRRIATVESTTVSSESPLGGVQAMLAHDLRDAVRSLLRHRWYATLVIATLAVGIGANTVIFSLVNGVLLRPLPYPNANRIVMVFRTVPRFGFARSTASIPDYVDWRDQAASFSHLAAYAQAQATYATPDGAERWGGNRVTGNLFDLLGVTPAAGRVITRDDDTPGAPPVIVLSYATWQSRFGGDETLVGRTITLAGDPVTVVGVMPSDFAFPSASTEFWMPLEADPARAERDANFLVVVGRLRPNVTVADAQAEMTPLAARIDATPGGNEGYGVFVESRHGFVVRNARTALLVFQGAVILVLLLACANVANLMLARASARQRELAVRSALGASRWRLARQLVLESVLLALAGGAIGVVGSVGALDLISTVVSSQLPRWSEVHVGTAVLGMSALVAVGCGLGCGSITALLTARAKAGTAVREGGHTIGLGRAGRSVQTSFVAVQVALAVILTAGAALLVGSFANLTSVDPGFDPTNVVAARARYAPPEPDPSTLEGLAPAELERVFASFTAERVQFFDDWRARVAALPGVSRVGLAYAMPFSGSSFSRQLVPEGFSDEGDPPLIDGNVVAGDFFSTMGMTLMAGRAFTNTDAADAPSVAVVNETMAQQLWPGDDPIGKRFRVGNNPDAPWTSIVGVVGDVRTRGLDDDRAPMYYRPLSQAAWPDEMYLVSRTAVSPEQVVPLIRRELWVLDPSIPLTNVATATSLIGETLAAPRFRTTVLLAFGGLAVLLAIVGVYGVMAYAVGERTREIGLRMALGAREGAILAMVLSRGARIAALGAGAGLIGALVLTRYLQGMLFGIAPRDIPTMLGAAVGLIAVALLASYLPARHAARIDPLVALRAE